MASPRKIKKIRRKLRHPYIVSACLIGINCTYKGTNKLNRAARSLYKNGLAMPVCPEVMGGLAIPRENSEIQGHDGAAVLAGCGRVVSASGVDLSKHYVAGSRAILDIARHHHIKHAILKSKSPACGCGLIYDGTFRRTIRRGNGVLAALLLKNHITISTL